MKQIDIDLLTAAADGNINELEEALNHDAHVEAKNEDGWTALMWASVNSNTDCVELLIKHGAHYQKKEDFMEKTFEKDETGYIVYKIFGLHYKPPSKWEIEQNSILIEDIDESIVKKCSYGINFSTLDAAKSELASKPIWKCKLFFKDMDKLVVPILATDSARCGRLQLLEII